MKEERLKILQLLSDNKITAEEAAKLITALGSSKPEISSYFQKGEEAEIAKSIKEKIKLDEDSFKKLGQTLSKSGLELSRKIGEEITRLVKDEEVKTAGRKLGSSMRGLGLSIRDEVKESLEELRRELAQEKNLIRETELSGLNRDDLEATYAEAEAELDGHYSADKNKERTDESVATAMDILRDSMDAVNDCIDELKSSYEDWVEDEEDSTPEDAEAFLQEIRQLMSQTAGAMADISEHCLTLENLAKNEQDIHYAQELIYWAKQRNERADLYLTELEVKLQAIQENCENSQKDFDSIF